MASYSKANLKNIESAGFHSSGFRTFTEFKAKASDHFQNQYKNMNDRFKIDSETNEHSFNRTCQASSGINENHLNSPYSKAYPEELVINSAAYISHSPHNAVDPPLQHSLSVMPPYRYGSSESSASLSLLPLSRRRWFQRQTCLLCIMVAFMFGLLLGVFAPMLDLRAVFANLSTAQKVAPAAITPPTSDSRLAASVTDLVWKPLQYDKPQRNRTPATATGDLSNVPLSPFSVAFINEHHARIDAEEILSDSVPNPAYVGYDVAPNEDYRAQRKVEKPLARTAERRVSKMLHEEREPLRLQASHAGAALTNIILQRPTVQKLPKTEPRLPGIINANIYWGDLVERALPKGFGAEDTRDWNAYVASQTVVQRLESGCGRMQNRLVVFSDGTRACARYRQNTDQIQGELFSFYLGRLLNMTNLAPSAVLTVNVESEKWSEVVRDITQAQWKQQRPVVLTRWLPNLEPAGIPQPFQPLDRHLNKHDVWNITLTLTSAALPLGSSLSDGAQHTYNTSTSNDLDSSPDITITPTSLALERLVELAQWSDLIIFDYLIANLDRVVNNLYNYQWNAEIMAAPAHNLARQSNSDLLIFLDNESGLLHGYRLLKKYEAYHGLLLNNLCVFRKPTIRALRQLREAGAGRKLRQLFEQTASEEVRDVLPTLPDKSIKILIDRIDRVLEQVDKCKQLMDDR
ncbi:extracellular serine/threonine protein kinase four-jointed [Anastrepha obliqua]|uniref:extracellular serine/threonine protein kinase four-jointed n=1 Tax=Anastrepha obliqua TaxID=95512 RepID=UPI0024092E4A|nr:extracellular serine/threonine protein kinase four-jointed [Anastrepha obliqua]